MKQFLSESPFIRLFIAFIIGILLRYYSDINYALALAIFGLLLCVNLSIFFNMHHIDLFRRRYVHGFALFLLMCSTSVFISSLRDEQVSASHFSHFSTAEEQYCILVTDDPSKNTSGTRFKASVIAVNKDSLSIKTQGNITVYINDSNALCSYGDRLLCTGSMKPIADAQNPYEFNNRQFAAHKNIYQQLFIQKGAYQIVKHQQGDPLLKQVHDIRKYLSACMDKSMQNTQAASVAKALLLGDDNDIENSLMQAYSSCGVIHVLSVSGLHVGIFFIIINYLFSFIKKEDKKIKFFKAIIIILLIWFYAALSGFSPSVLRSAVMLSFVAFGNALSRKISIYNSLSASAVFLLCYHSDYLFDVGFQLSYISVFGIIYLQPKVYQCWSIKNYLGDKIWQMTSVSIAAQFVTFPLSVYYFYQFPTLFLIANLLIIPLITIALFAGFAFLVLCSLHSEALLFYVVKPLEYTLIIINKCILWIDSIPYNAIKNIFLSPIETIIIYCLFLLFFFWLELKQVKLLQYLLACTLVFMLFLSFEKMNDYQKTNLIVYSLNKMQRIEMTHQQYSQVFTTCPLSENDRNYSFHIKAYRVHHKVMTEHETIIEKGNYDILCSNMHILFLNKKDAPLEQLSSQKYDLVIVGHNAIHNFEMFKKNCHYKALVLDNSNSLSFIKEANRRSLSFHNIKTDKAFVMEL